MAAVQKKVSGRHEAAPALSKGVLCKLGQQQSSRRPASQASGSPVQPLWVLEDSPRSVTWSLTSGRHPSRAHSGCAAIATVWYQGDWL